MKTIARSVLASALFVIGSFVPSFAEPHPPFLRQFGFEGFGQGGFGNPAGVVVASDGYSYVSDPSISLVQKFDPAGNFVWQVGGFGTADGQLKEPMGVALDVASGNLYVVDSRNRRIQVFTPSGQFVRKFGAFGTTPGLFDRPFGITVVQGFVYVSDPATHRIEKFGLDGTFVAEFGPGFLSKPQWLASSQSGDIYVTDGTLGTNMNVHKCGGDGHDLGVVPNLSGFTALEGVWIDGTGAIYLVDQGNNRVRKYDALGIVIYSLGGPGSEPGRFNGPMGITVGSAGDVYVVDPTNERIQVFGFGPQDTLFTPPYVPYVVGNTPYGLAMGDLNQDGYPDAVTTANGPSQISVLLNQGDGTFAPAVIYPSPSVTYVAIGDLNGDGSFDVVASNQAGHAVTVRLGNGNGAFSASTSYSSGGTTESIAVGDVTGDGKADVVVTDYAPAGNVSVLVGNGTGGFSAPQLYPVGAYPENVQIADLNGDGAKDLVTANYGGGGITILYNDGSGIFGSRLDIPTGANPYCVAIGDVDENGTPDLVVSHIVANTVSIIRADGAGGYLPKVDYPLWDASNSVALIDFSGDGHLDLTMAEAEVGAVELRRGVGDGTFGPATYSQGAMSPFFIVSSDVDRDDRPDVVVANIYLNTITVLRNTRGTAFVGVPDQIVPAGARLAQSVPNPSAGSSVISFVTPEAGFAELRVFDVKGRSIRTLATGRIEAGPHVAKWDGVCNDGTRAVPGVYFYELHTGSDRLRRRLVLLR